jgi:hypothetical protein
VGQLHSASAVMDRQVDPHAYRVVVLML